MQLGSNTNARRTISSSQTFFMKFIFPAIWVLIFGAGTFSTFLSSARSNDPFIDSLNWIFLAAFLFGSSFIYWACIRLKRVRMDSEALYISNYREEIRVALRDISAVSENRWVNIHPITVEFCSDSAFGNRINFMPESRWWGWRSHPIVAELCEAARHAGSLAITSQMDMKNGIPNTSGYQKAWVRRVKIGLAIAACLATFVVLLLVSIERAIKSSQVYELSIMRAHAANEVLEYIGQPFREGWFVSGSLSETGDGTGNAVLSIPLSGPKGNGRLHVEAQRRDGIWTFRALQLEVIGQRSQINLLSQ
jgi:hypothetical protein